MKKKKGHVVQPTTQVTYSDETELISSVMGDNGM